MMRMFGAEMPKRTGIFLLFTGNANEKRTAALEGMSNLPPPTRHSESNGFIPEESPSQRGSCTGKWLHQFDKFECHLSRNQLGIRSGLSYE